VGHGVTELGTIPAYLQKGLEKVAQGPVCVTNFAESAYVSMQGVIMLLTQLRSGNVPDVVIFYTIVDDTYAAYQSGRAGVLEKVVVQQNEAHGRGLFQHWPNWLPSLAERGRVLE
jgi:hypothetical protein